MPTPGDDNTGTPNIAGGPPAELPILARRAEIEAAIREHQVCIICGATGSGKTTQLPRICVSAGRGRAGIIGHTQPRRIAARSVAARIALEMNVALGGLVGCKVRFTDRTSAETKIKVMTDGILLAETQGDRRLSQYDTIIIDEAHERSLNIDFLLGILRGLVRERKDLRVVVTSATIDPARFSDHFGGESAAPIIEVSGRTYPVEVRSLDLHDDDDDFERVEEHAVLDAVDELTRPAGPAGDVLVFLPGERDIRLIADALRRGARPELEILPLFARLSSDEQDRVFRPTPGGRRRVILATNVAETSLTVPGIRFVVDTGLARISRYDPDTRVQRLPIEPISRASADQRAGRCGRVAAGVCVRLYSRASYESRPAFTAPEVLRTSLASVILRMRSLCLGPVETFPFVEAPSAGQIKDGYETLFELGALTVGDSRGELTPIGEKLARLPLDPRVGRILLAAADEGCVGEALVLGAALSVQDPRDRPIGRERNADQAQADFLDGTSDFITLLNIFRRYCEEASSRSHGGLHGWCRERFLSFNRMREWDETHRQIRELALDIGLEAGRPAPGRDAVHRAVLSGLVSNVCSRDGVGGFEYAGVRGGTVHIFPGSVAFRTGPRWIVAAQIVETSRLFARVVAPIDPEWLFGARGCALHMVQRTVSDHHVHPETGEPSAWERVTLGELVVAARRRVPLRDLDPRAARAMFIRRTLLDPDQPGDAAFAAHNRDVFRRALELAAKLRRRSVLEDESSIAHFFEERLGESVCDRASLDAWRTGAEAKDAGALFLNDSLVMRSEAIGAATTDSHPDWLDLGTEGGRCRLEYRFEPGRDSDGLTLRLPLTSLPALNDDRVDWLVPGMLEERVLAMMRCLARPLRAALEAAGDLAALAHETAGVMTFASGHLGAALSEAIEALRGVKVPGGAWTDRGIPEHLRMRIVVVDHTGVEVGSGRDVAELRARLAGRLRKALAGAARAKFERDGVREWEFGDLPDRVPTEQGGAIVDAFPALVDRGTDVSSTLAETAGEAAAWTRFGLRRLFVIAVEHEVEATIRAMGNYAETERHARGVLSPEELIDGLKCVIAERVFMSGLAPVRTQAQFEERVSGLRGRLAQTTAEVTGAMARILEARFRVAGRLAGGTPRLWAASVADIREQAAFLMPRGFLRALAWDRLREYPRYLDAMRERLFRLREDGSGAETTQLRELLERWKRFTGWLAAAIARERSEWPTTGSPAASGVTRKGRSPLPPQRGKRGAVLVNLEAAEWAMQPGALPPEIAAYRWGLEDYRVALFSGAPDAPALGKSLDAQWKAIDRAQ